MITGHAGLALGARGVRDDVPLRLLILAAYAPDLAQVLLDAVGCDTATASLWSHSLAATTVLAVLSAVVLGRASRAPRAQGVAWSWGAAGAGGALVVLHLLTDYVTGHKPTWAHGPLVGLDLYDRPLGDFALEAVVVTGGWLLARRGEASRGRRPRPAVLWLLLLAQAAANAPWRLRGRL